jgi:glutaredoxin
MSEKSEQHSVTLYSKAGCHLCEIAKDALLSLGDEFVVELEEVDITTDPALFELYRYTIPVMIVDRQIKLEARITAQKLRRALSEGYGPKIK